MLSRLILITSVVLFACISEVYGQIPDHVRWKKYAFFAEDYRIDSLRQEQLYFRISNHNFFKNNEYKNDFRIGQTLVGLWAEPRIEYYADDKTRISAGAHLLKYHGRDGYDRIIPTFSVEHRLNPHLQLTFGTIRGAANHGMLEPIYEFERQLIAKNENGFQFRVDYPWLQADL